MKHNTAQVAMLEPEYLGFIFFDGSPRNFEQPSFELMNSTKKVGVFVDASIEFVINTVKQHNLKVVQLHGGESPDYCTKLIEQNRQQNSSHEIQLWKVFSIKDEFDFNRLIPYEGIVHKFLFDTKGKQKGGNGYTFNWDVLRTYPSKTPFILSGGIGLAELDKVDAILTTHLPIYGIDVNSKFETAPGLKDISQLKELIQHMASRQ